MRLPWVVVRRTTFDAMAAHQRIDLEQLERILTMIAVLQHGVDWNTKQLREMPEAVVAALREVPAKVLAPIVAQPPSVGLADKRRVQEAREREKEAR